MKGFIRNIILFFLFIVLVNCEDELTSRNYPRLKTLPVTGINSEGAELHAQFIFRGDFEILTYGFVWDMGENPTLEGSNRIIKQDNIVANSYSARVETDLKEGVTYFVRAFVETEDFVVYGENVEFVGTPISKMKSNTFRSL